MRCLYKIAGRFSVSYQELLIYHLKNISDACNSLTLAGNITSLLSSA